VLSVGSIDSERLQAAVNPPPRTTTLEEGELQRKNNGVVSEGMKTPISPSSSTAPPAAEGDHDLGARMPSPVQEASTTPRDNSSAAGGSVAGPPESEAGPSTATVPTPPRKASSFRYVPLRPPPNNAPRTSSPLRPPGTPTAMSPGMSSRHFDQSPRTTSEVHDRPTASAAATFNGRSNRSSLLVTTPVNVAPDRANVTPDPVAIPSRPQATHRSTPSIVVQPADVVTPPQRSTSLAQPPPPPPKSSASSPITSGPSTRVSSPIPPSTPSTSASGSHSNAAQRAVYRPGFQPKGVYRPLTDDFIAHRKRAREVSRIEQTRLERRLEKLIQLHFPTNSASQGANAKEKVVPKPMRRASSLFELDFNELRTKSPSDLWREMLDNRVAAGSGGKNDIRGMPSLPLCDLEPLLVC
jgi:hypothetical protein